MSSRSSELKTTEYAHDVLVGRVIASQKVEMACQRHINDLKRAGSDDFPWVFSPEKGFRAVDFIQRFCKPSQGDFDRLELEPWQHFIIGSLHGWVHKDTGLRRFKEGLIFVGRKNGKSTMVSGLSLYGSSKDGENGARVYLLANSMKQARVVFDECKNMVKKSPILQSHFQTVLHEIRYDQTFSRIEPQASDSEKLDGLNCHLGIFDEIHEYKDYKMINVIKNSTGARKQPLILYITTAGYQLDGPLMDYYEKSEDVLTGAIQDERSFYYMAEIDPEDDMENPKNWVKANPNMGVTLDLQTLIEEWNSRKHVPGERSDFITKRLNVFCQTSEQSFIDYEIVKRNADTIDLEQLQGKECIGGFDLSNTEDFTSACLEFPLGEGRVFVLSHTFVPKRKADLDSEKIPYWEWKQEGLLTICDGDYVDYQLVLDWFIEKAKLYNIKHITYDPANAYRLVEDLKSHGFATEVVRQGAKTLNAPMKDVKELLLDGKVVFNQSKLFRWYLNNVKLVVDRNGNWLPTKQSRYRKIDGFAAWLNAHVKVMEMMVRIKPTGNIEFFSINDLMK
ncbi:terminase large subunit [Marininema halotolerans]|uniref:Phage terminase-like protein, large subunit, contains N-terminal HTH domain n=1 Tax=Marininema halotolerans TaxID=1155944 RepID=A0A1I6URU2_9BACL|nr:terminase large subunit [Marininema halotolerans]SFT04171.1 Phage terminase-like protein, large subunit, contains N-terminal HTH domain [Marininema halotolerans]